MSRKDGVLFDYKLKDRKVHYEGAEFLNRKNRGEHYVKK